MIGLFQRFFRKTVDEGFTTAIKQAAKYIGHKSHIRIITSSPPSVLYFYFQILTNAPNRSDANPINPIWVNPDEIVYYHGSGPRGFGRVVAGEWDKPARKFEQNVVYRSIKKRYSNDLSWQETELYEVYSKLPENKSLYRRAFKNKEQLSEYLNQIDKLYTSVSEHGYKTQKELLKNGEAPSDPTSDTLHILLNEVTVHIYRDGSLAKSGSGNHRLSIAKVHPNVEKIPVLVKVRHAKWQQIRNEINTTDSYDNLSPRAKQHLDHPDLRDIVPENWIV